MKALVIVKTGRGWIAFEPDHVGMPSDFESITALDDVGYDVYTSGTVLDFVREWGNTTEEAEEAA